MSRRRIQHAGRTLHLVEQGPPAGEARATVFLVHGYVLSQSVFGKVAGRLVAAGLRVVRTDLAGHGWDREPLEETDLHRLGDDLAAVLHQLRAEDPRGTLVALGHSMGGMALMTALDDHPTLAGELDGVVWLATSPGRMRTSSFGLPAGTAPLVGPLVSTLAPAVMTRLGADPAARPRPRPLALVVEAAHLRRSNFVTRPARAVGAHVLALHHRVPYAVMASLLRSILVHDAEDLLRRLDLPGLVLVGDHDRMTPLSHSRRIAELHRGARLEVVPRAGHLLMLEQPAAVAAAITTFVDRLSPSTPEDA